MLLRVVRILCSEGCDTDLQVTAWIGLGAVAEDPARRASRTRARAAEVIMAAKTQDMEFRHPEAVTFLQDLTDE